MTLAPEKTLADVVEKYKSLTGKAFGIPVTLAAFGCTQAETERTFGRFDEDYQISRYFHFTQSLSVADMPAHTYQINGFLQTHVSLDAEIVDIL